MLSRLQPRKQNKVCSRQRAIKMVNGTRHYVMQTKHLRKILLAAVPIESRFIWVVMEMKSCQLYFSLNRISFNKKSSKLYRLDFAFWIRTKRHGLCLPLDNNKFQSRI